MDYQAIMDILSQCGLGAVLLSDRDQILRANETGIHLLHGEGGLTGKLMDEIAPQLCQESEEPLYANIALESICCAVPRHRWMTSLRERIWWCSAMRPVMLVTICSLAL